MIKEFTTTILGRTAAYRLGRALYMQSRGDIANDMHSNGELMIQECVVGACKRYSLREEVVVFDVGANVGAWSEHMISLLEGDDRNLPYALYLFEPVSDTAQVLRANLGESECLHYESLAMSSECGEAYIHIGAEVAAGTNSLHHFDGGSEFKRIPIMRTTLDEFCKSRELDRIDLLKCDAEGHDMDVIEGASSLLERGKIAVMQFEYNHRWIAARHYLKDVFDMINDFPYKLGKVCPGHIELYDSWHPEHEKYFEANYVLIRNDVQRWFQIRRTRLGPHNTLVPGSY